MLNELLSNDLAQYYDLMSLEEEAAIEGVSVDEIKEGAEYCKDYVGVEIVGVLRIKEGYEDASYECDGSFYGADNKIYYMYGYDNRVVEHDEEYAIECVEEE